MRYTKQVKIAGRAYTFADLEKLPENKAGVAYVAGRVIPE